MQPTVQVCKLEHTADWDGGHMQCCFNEPSKTVAFVILNIIPINITM